MENQIQNLVNIILKLSDKIENLEHKIEVLIQEKGVSKQQSVSEFPKDPPLAFLEWIESFIVTTETFEVICQQSILDGFKHCLCDNFQRQLLPLFVKGRPRQLYVFVLQDDDSGWQPFTDAHLDNLIQDVWRKILQRFMNDTEMFIGEDERTQNYRDICMKKIMEMRKILASRHRKEIMRCLITSTRDKNIP
jgi:hypothetical protein